MAQEQDAETVGWVGLGNMGGPMAARVVGAGHRVVGADLSAGARSRFEQAGGEAVASVAEVRGRARTVLLSLPTGAVAERVLDDLIADDSIVERVVDLSTIGTPAAERLAARAAEAGIVWIDAPVSGGVAAAVEGRISVMPSGDAATIATVAELLHPLGTVFVVGDRAGQGQAVKLANNYLSALTLAASIEAVATGMSAGVDPGVLAEVISVSSGRNSAVQDKLPRAILPGTFDLGFTTELMVKDVELFAEQARAGGVPLWVGASVREIWAHALAALGGDADLSRIAQLYEGWTGTQIRSAGDRPSARLAP